VVFPDRTIDELVARRPQSTAELAAIHGLGPSRLARFGAELAAALHDALALGSEAAPATAPPPDSAGAAAATALPADADARTLYDALAAWRRARAAQEEVPAFHVFANRVLGAIAAARPRSREELAAVPGVGPAKLDRYGEDVLEVVAAA
jgi:ATP-dependent DNA helicase RecQ